MKGIKVNEYIHTLVCGGGGGIFTRKFWYLDVWCSFTYQMSCITQCFFTHIL